MPKRISRRKTYEKDAKKAVFLTSLRLAGLGFLFFSFLAAASFLYFAKDLPRPERFSEHEVAESTKVFDRTGKILLYEMYGEEKRTVIALERVPPHLKNAIIATEDSKFYTHFGIDPAAILRSIAADIKLGAPKYGGSTISQQLIRSSYLSISKTVARKVKEIILALELERRYSKEQILGFYLNQVPFGNNAYGVEAASQTYFGKSVEDVSLPEAAVLAALIQKPSYFGDIDKNKDELLERKDYVLRRMYQDGHISQTDKEEAQRQVIVFRDLRHSIKAPHFVLYVRDYLLAAYGEDFLKENGLKVVTSLDWNIQQVAEKTVRDGAERNKLLNAYNAALVAISPKTGEILAMVGSKDYFAEPQGCSAGRGCKFDPQVNVATFSIGRQPGSAFKPFVYATAFNKGYTDATIVVDEPTNFGVFGGKEYAPQNYDGRFRGPVTLRGALAQSLNVPSVKVLAYLAGLQDSIKTAQAMGITTLNRPPSYYGLSLVLGGGEVRLLDMVSAYGAFANDGMRIPPVSIIKIEDQYGTVLEENKKNPEKILPEKTARLVNSVLSDNNARAPVFGSRSDLYVPGYQVAAKSGTTQDFKDGWLIGYTPSIVAGVWAGNNNGEEMSKDPAVVTAGPMWRIFMERVLPLYPRETFPTI
ncbi:MAG: hypothetical protein A3I38_03055 [Candidatus Wildermuthbacteria bacterium RIFCSPLOWO2_02_FULL_47_10]|nr:MAG: hypothetical protein A3I38_03055 [Candidatus Wildermuthbacteria bacterium RIFCSPLOWO2_02_FULL_47_10]